MHGQCNRLPNARGDLLLVDSSRDVEGEIHPRGGRDRPDRVVDGIAVDDAPRGSRIADTPRVVELKGGCETGESWATIFGPTAEPREEMWLDEAGRDPQVRGHPFPIQEDRNVPDHPHVDLPCVVAGVMVLHTRHWASTS